MGLTNNASIASIPVIAFVGRSGCGKTTLLEHVLPLLLHRQVRLSVIKHTWHTGIDSDIEGTDTRRLWDMGVPDVVLATPDRVVRWRAFSEEPSLDGILAEVRGVDAIILEGFKKAPYPKIEVLRAAHDPEPLQNLAHRIAFVTDVYLQDSTVPSFALDDYAGLADFLYKFIMGSS